MSWIPVILHDHSLSSFAQKVKIALREKGMPFEATVPPDFGTGRTDTASAAANPRREVPVLLAEDGTAISGSAVILDYLGTRHPDPPLLPPDPAARARMVEPVCDAQHEAVNWAWGEVLWFRRATGALADRLRAAARRDTGTLQSWLADRLGPADWLNGEHFGHADLAAVPMVNRSVHYGLGPPAGSPLAGWHACVAPGRRRDAGRVRRRGHRDHRLDWMVRSGGIDVVLAGLRDDTIRFSRPGDEDARFGNTDDTRAG